ncbi:MAG: MBL fold metallo-hydrolase [Candidatus Lokiarchaeota archaeon]|nr:MBL fold metallo-hydrolase [Candidatus Lokiarchaeota archaeon]
MSISKIRNLDISKVKDDILLVHQIRPPHYFSCCDGLIILPKKGRNSTAIVLDLNIEPDLIIKINEIFGPVSDYICSHGHMDHITHVHQWDALGVKIYAPHPVGTYLLDLHNFFTGYGFDKAMNFSAIQQFAEINRYLPCNNVLPFNSGDTFEFENLSIETIPLRGHSKAHVGFFIPKERILHISCLGYDLMSPESKGFGPWYGFEECSIDQYIDDIKLVESMFLEKADLLTSSHSNIIKNPDITPFSYMLKRIVENQKIVDQAILELKLKTISDENLNELLKIDLFFPKKKMNGFMLEIYTLWESIIIGKHMEKSKYFNI